MKMIANAMVMRSRFIFDDVTGLSGVHRAGDHVGDARALAGVQQDEHDEADARNDEQDERDDEERIHVRLSLFRSKVYRYASCYSSERRIRGQEISPAQQGARFMLLKDLTKAGPREP